VKAPAAALALALALVPTAGAAAVDETRFRWERTLETSGGLSAFEPDGPLYEHARRGFADLRVLDARGRQVPWRLRSLRGDGRLQAAQVLNSGTQGSTAVALLDFGPERLVRERIQLDVPPVPFVGRAEVAGSDDRTTFTRLSSTSIYDVRGATRAVSSVVVFPPSDFRYYRIRATGVRRIRGATAEPAPAEAPVEREATIEVRQEERATEVDADLGYRGVPVHELRFASSTPAFDRPVEVSGSMDGRAYFVAGGGRLYRFGGEGETTVPLASRYRYLRIRIANGDDEPLRDLRVTLRAYRDEILLAPGYAPPYRVLYGGPAVQPRYDFAQLPEVRAQPEPAALGPERANEAFEARDPRSFAERHSALVTAALALAAAVLLAGGFLALRKRSEA
jgi:Protein of unknown function (DUF3999)